MAKPIKSPFYKEKEEKIRINVQKAIDKEEVDSCFVFMIPKDKNADIVIFSRALCGHQLLKLAELITEKAEKMLEDENDEDHNHN